MDNDKSMAAVLQLHTSVPYARVIQPYFCVGNLLLGCSHEPSITAQQPVYLRETVFVRQKTCWLNNGKFFITGSIADNKSF